MKYRRLVIKKRKLWQAANNRGENKKQIYR